MTEKPSDNSAALMVQGLSPKSEDGQSALDRFGPLVAFVIYVVGMFLLSFDVLPNPGPVTGLLALFGPFIGAWATKLAVK